MLLLCILFFPIVFSLHLNTEQLICIRRCIKSGQLTQNQRTNINLILYKSYEKWACKKAIEFRKIHKHKCYNIDKDELALSSKIGLYKSIQKYNGNYDIINYATIYVRSELLRLITDTYSSSILPKSIRKRGKNNLSTSAINEYKYLLGVTYTHHYENWQIERTFLSQQEDMLKKYSKNEDFYTVFNFSTPFTKRVVYLKYFYTIQILSNKHVSDLMCCSEETIRQHLQLFTNTNTNTNTNTSIYANNTSFTLEDDTNPGALGVYSK